VKSRIIIIRQTPIKETKVLFPLLHLLLTFQAAYFFRLNIKAFIQIGKKTIGELNIYF